MNGISRKGIEDVGFFMVDNDEKALARATIGKKLLIEKDDPALDGELQEILTVTPKVVAVAGMGGKYSPEVVTALCREHKRIHGDMGFIWVFTVLPFSFERCDERAADALATVNEVASKVITFDNNTLREHNGKPLNEALAIVDQKVCDLLSSAMTN